MAYPPIAPKPVIERPADDLERGELTAHALHVRIRQQEILADLGVLALQGRPFLDLLNETVRLTADGMEAEFCKILEYLPAQNRLLVRAGVGWHQGIVGVATVGADLESPSGFALHTGKPVISNHLENEQRFRTPELLVEHGIRRAMNVILQGDGSPYGVLEVDSRSDGEFSEHDISFLQGAANILGMAIERQRYELRLKAALDRQQILAKETNHRVKNSLQMVSAMLRLQANAVGDDTLKTHLAEASSRVSAIGRAYERLSYDSDVENINLGPYLKEVCRDALSGFSHCKLDFDPVQELQLDTDRAISLALLINELVTNSVKHGLRGRSDGHVWVHLAQKDENSAVISVCDNGVGLPADFDLSRSRGLGMRIIAGLSEQLQAAISHRADPNGTEFVLTFPLRRRADG
jgi:two-component sensor histidine kinase